jgi:hypothetical protein
LDTNHDATPLDHNFSERIEFNRGAHPGLALIKLCAEYISIGYITGEIKIAKFNPEASKGEGYHTIGVHFLGAYSDPSRRQRIWDGNEALRSSGNQTGSLVHLPNRPFATCAWVG